MASRRLASSSVDWAEFGRKIPDAQRASFNALKNKTDGYVRKIAALPEAPPKLDWQGYKARIAVPGMVDNFQKQWEALKVPYPKDTLSSQIEQQAAQEKTNYEKFVSESKTRIQGINQEKAKWEAMMPVEEMNLEEACAAGLGGFGGVCVDYNHPKLSFWPHDEDYDAWRKKVEEIKRTHTQYDELH